MRKSLHLFGIGASRLLPETATQFGAVLRRPPSTQPQAGTVGERLPPAVLRDIGAEIAALGRLDPHSRVNCGPRRNGSPRFHADARRARSFGIADERTVELDARWAAWECDFQPACRASDPAGKSTSSPLDLVSGNYTLSIQGVANATGTYQFQLLDLANAANR